MMDTTVILDTFSGCNVIHCSALPLSLQFFVCPNYEIPPVRDADGDLLQILSAVILRIQFVSAVYKTIFLVANYFNMVVRIGT